MIPCMMPLKPGHWVAEDVLEGLLGQFGQPLFFPVTGIGGHEKRSGEAISRNVCIELLHQLKVPVGMMMDRDVVLDEACDVRDAVQCLVDDNTVGAVHLRIKRRYVPDKHYDIGCVVFRPELVKPGAFKVEREEKDGCLCTDFTRALGEASQVWLKDSRSGHTYFYDDHY